MTDKEEKKQEQAVEESKETNKPKEAVPAEPPKAKTEEAPAKAKEGSPEKAAPAGGVEPRRKRGKKPFQRRRPRERKDSDLIEKVVTINRVSKVVQGGKNFSFAALVVVGDGKGKVGFAIGKAREVADAVQKGLKHAKNRMKPVPMVGTTIPHEMVTRFGAAKVFLKPASQGTGVIAGSPVRAVCECAGIKDILTKSLGSQTPMNVVQATLQGLREMLTPSTNDAAPSSEEAKKS